MVERSFDKSTVRTFSLQTVTTNRTATGAPYDLCAGRQTQFYVFQLICPNATYICLHNVDLPRTEAPHTLSDSLSSNLRLNKQLSPYDVVCYSCLTKLSEVHIHPGNSNDRK